MRIYAEFSSPSPGNETVTNLLDLILPESFAMLPAMRRRTTDIGFGRGSLAHLREDIEQPFELHKGDEVQVLGPTGRKLWLAKFQYAKVNELDEVVEITVVGGPGHDPAGHRAFYTFVTDRITLPKKRAVRPTVRKTAKGKPVKKREFRHPRYHFPRADFQCVDEKNCVHIPGDKGLCQCCGKRVTKKGKRT